MGKHKITRSSLQAAKDTLEKAGIPWVVFAGDAAHCYGSTREITDIDVLVKLEDLKKAQAAIKSIGAEAFDVVAFPDFFLDDEMIKRIKQRKLLGVTVPVIPVEDNIILKAKLHRGKDQGKHDVEDMEVMIKNEPIDLEYLKKGIQKWKATKKAKTLLQTLLQEEL
jgi:hypothetical protein